MYSTVQSETAFFLISVLSGAIIAFLYDILRIKRRIVAASDSVVNGEDILFFAFTAVFLFYHGIAHIQKTASFRCGQFLFCLSYRQIISQGCPRLR